MKKGNKGVVIVIVLAFTAAISVMAMFLSVRAKEYISVFSGAQRNNEMENLAEMGIRMGKVLLDTTQTRHIITEVPGYIQKKYEIDGREIEITIEDESGKINPNIIFGPGRGEVNTRLLEVYKRFFSVMGYPTRLSDALLDWIDEDDIPRVEGAESIFYRTAGFAYTVPNRAPYTPAEIILVSGFTEEIVFGDDETKGLINFITSFSNGKINVNTCQLEVLNALGFSGENIDKIIAERERRPVEEKFMLEVNKEAYLKYRAIIVFKSNYFAITSRVIDAEGYKKEARAYVLRTDKSMDTVKMEMK